MIPDHSDLYHWANPNQKGYHGRGANRRDNSANLDPNVIVWNILLKGKANTTSSNPDDQNFHMDKQK